jgi:hypothetical protein
MNTNTQRSNEPLYKLLNEEITQGEWDVMNLYTSEPIVIRNGGQGYIMTAGSNVEERKANALYTTLAVNNLNQLAEALERLDFLLEGDCRPMYLHARGIIKEALNKIS